MRHRVAPHALVDPLARDHAAARGRRAAEQLELAPREADARGRRRTPRTCRAGSRARRPRPGPADSAVTRAGLPRAQRRLDARQHLLGVARLGDPVVRAEAQPAHALGDGASGRCRRPRPARADARAQAARGRPMPPSRACATSITIACWRIALQLLDRRRAGQHLRAPADRADALRQHADEAAVGVDDREPDRRGAGGGVACVGQETVRRLRRDSTEAECRGGRRRSPSCDPIHRIFTSRTRAL